MPYDWVISGLGEVMKGGHQIQSKGQSKEIVHGLDRLRPSTPVYGFLWKSRDPPPPRGITKRFDLHLGNSEYPLSFLNRKRGGTFLLWWKYLSCLDSFSE